jgi:hypothetical protein
VYFSFCRQAACLAFRPDDFFVIRAFSCLTAEKTVQKSAFGDARAPFSLSVGNTQTA